MDFREGVLTRSERDSFQSSPWRASSNGIACFMAWSATSRIQAKSFARHTKCLSYAEIAIMQYFDASELVLLVAVWVGQKHCVA